MKTTFKIFISGFALALVVVWFILSVKPLTPKEQAEKQKQEKEKILTGIFGEQVFVKDTITGECLRLLFRKDVGAKIVINRLASAVPCDCEKIPPELLITAEIQKNAK